MAKLFANSGDPDQTPQNAASDLGLHCLPLTLLRVTRLQWVNPCPAEPGYTLHLQTVKIQISWLLKKPIDLDLHCLTLSMWIYSNNLDQVIRLAKN